MNEKEEKKENGFNFLGADRIRSPENLNEYIRISTPKAWIGITALAILVVSLFVFGISGTVPVYYSVKGAGFSMEQQDAVDAVVCLVDPADVTAGDLEDKEAELTFRDGRAASGRTSLLFNLPQNQDTIREELGQYGLDNDWILSQLPQYPYLYVMLIRLDQDMDPALYGEIADVSLITREVRPYVYLFNGEA